MKYPVVHGVRRPEPRTLGRQFERQYEFEGLVREDDALMVPLDGRKPDSVRGVVSTAFKRLKKNHPDALDFEIETHYLADKAAIGVWRKLGGNGNGGGNAEKPAVSPAEPVEKLQGRTLVTQTERHQQRTEGAYHHHCGHLITLWLERKVPGAKVTCRSALYAYLGVTKDLLADWIENREPIPHKRLVKIAELLGAPSFEAFMAADQ